MILKSITPKHFGPFAADTTLHLDPEVTVLTGPNDAGKSLALRAIEILCTQSTIDSHEVNRDRTGEFSGKWQDDTEIACIVIFETTESTPAQKGLPKGTRPGATVTVHRRMTATQGKIIEINVGRTRSEPQSAFNPPHLLKLPLATEVRQEINFENLTDAESHLIRLGFGREFSLEQHKSLDQIARSFRIDEAESRLNEKLHRILPKAMPLSFKLLEVGAQPELLGVGLIDEHRGYAPLGSRGAGVRKLLNVMGALLRVNPDDGHTIVLYDEPETSLHADAQHMLRRLMESLASHPNVQVIYTTHSPAMVNNLRPRSIRVLERKRVGEKAVSLFVNNACGENYNLVRSSLGVSPADSLLYAPITVIAEGTTEVQCVPLVLMKLSDNGVIPADMLETLLSQTHILDGEGSSFEYMCRLAKSQNAKPIVFLDGDKQADVQKVKDKHPEVAVIVLASGTEFEDVVPKAKYIQATAEVLEDEGGDICEGSFLEWEQKASLRPSVMFSKRVERWLRDEFDKPLYKPLVMRRAIELTDTPDIQTEPFKQLIEAMRKVGETL
ncbi:MAG: AAA family ATPase [Candidatus Paceibacterota bacterium]